MTRRAWTRGVTAAAVMLLAGLAAASAHSEEKSTEPDIAKGVRKELSGLPYYGVFDLLTFQVGDKGVVTLGGYVYHATLKDDAEKAVKRVKGVTSVENKIEILPVSNMDDDIRGAVYRAIYRDPALSLYGTPEDQLLASRPRFRPWGRGFRSWPTFGEPRWTGRPFLGMEPVGTYAIHIIVANGNVTLVGVVDRQADKDLAGMKANGVAGVFKVTNDLQVESQAKVKPKAK